METKILGRCHHVSWARGYVGRGVEIVKPYRGKFGCGFTVEWQDKKSNRYHKIAYYIA